MTKAGEYFKMAIEISAAHRKRFEEIRRNLTLLGSKEINFLEVELLFYEVLSIAKDYGDDEANDLLARVRQLDQNEYRIARIATAKKNQRESNIRHFISGLKRILSAR